MERDDQATYLAVLLYKVAKQAVYMFIDMQVISYFHIPHEYNIFMILA